MTQPRRGKDKKRSPSCHRFFPVVYLILSMFLGIIGLTACGGGGDGGGEQPPAPTTGTASGGLIIPPNNVVEQEPNNTISQAQAVSDSSTVSGNAAVSDPGFTIPGTDGAKAEDLFSLNVSGRVRIILTIASDDLNINDLDLILMDSSGNVIDTSEGFISTEYIETSGPGNFLVGVRAFQGSSAYIFSLASLGSLSSAESEIIPPGAEFVPGDILVKLKTDGTVTQQKVTSLAIRYGMKRKLSFPEDIELMQVSIEQQPLQKGKIGSKLNLPKSQENALKALTLDMIKRLRMDPDIEYAEPNFIRKPSLVPNDEFYSLQWHYQLINLPQAWDITTGSNSVIVAVIDTGVLLNHPDLSSRLIAGYDFISDPTSANDGDGIDSDPNDLGDDPQGASSSFHGTHVAGTIGAATNNTTGVAGVTWQSRIMPLRVLGVGGGTDADIAQAIRYAAGLSNSSGTVPSERADIINMSLGGPGFNQTQNGAIQAARAQGVVIVAAAGNENVSTFSYPASYDGVVSVSAVDINSQKAPYSNYGTKIDVAAPGGDMGVDLNGDGFLDGVLSTIGSDVGDLGYWFSQGTSMASPHVAGVLALMLAVNPNLTPDDIDLLLAGTHPDTMIRITRDLGTVGRDDIYGHGLIDASQAVIAAQSIPGGTGTIPTESILAVSSTSLDFDNYITSLPVDITNAGTGTLNITNITDNAPWLTITPSSGIAPLTVNANVNRTGLSVGEYNATINITSDAGQGNQIATINVKMGVGGTTSGNVGTVFVLVVDVDTLDTVDQAVTSASQSYSFTTPEITSGTYIIVAGTDRDDDGFICDLGEACGFYPDLITITAGQNTSNINFTVGDLISPQSVTGEFSSLRGTKFKRL